MQAKILVGKRNKLMALDYLITDEMDITIEQITKEDLEGEHILAAILAGNVAAETHIVGGLGLLDLSNVAGTGEPMPITLALYNNDGDVVAVGPAELFDVAPSTAFSLDDSSS